MLAQGAFTSATCASCLAMKSSSAPILICGDFDGISHPESVSQHDHHHPHHTLSCFGDGSFIDEAPVEGGKFLSQIGKESSQPKPLGDGSSKLSSQKDCKPTFIEGERNSDGEEFVLETTVKKDGSLDIQECAFPMKVKQVGSEKSVDRTCIEKQREEYETEQCGADSNQALKVHVDTNACTSQMDKLSVNVTEEQEFHGSPRNKHMQSTDQHMQTVSTGWNEDVLDSSNEKESEDQSSVTPPPSKPAVWCTPEPKAKGSSEPEFIMEASSWPTLAEARHAKPFEACASPYSRETISVSSPSKKENSVEPPKHSNTNTSQTGSKYRPSYKKGGIPGYIKPSFPATENIPVPPMGVHVPSANMYTPDQSIKGNGRAGMNTFYPGPCQAPANGPFYQHRGEGLGPFQHNAAVMPPYGRGHPGWQHYGRGYSDANYKYSVLSPAYNQQQMGPRHMRAPMAPFVNFNAHYNYPNFPGGDMSYMAPAFSPGYNYATPYVGPSGHPGGVMQGYDVPTLLGMLQRQIEYYFSKENLIRDIYLTSKMDEEGFVPLSLIASFPRVRNLTSNSMLVLEALKNSSSVEVKNGKLRSYEWRRQSSGTSQTNGVENSESCAPLSSTGVDHARDQGIEESGESGGDKLTTLPESKLITGSCLAPWTGLAANLGTGNASAVTSIDSR